MTAQADENGSPIVVGPDGADITSVDEAAYAAAFDPETGALLEGYTYKESTGVSFDSASESLQLITQFPEISEDGRSLTATWDTFYVDYQTAGVFPGVPAHVVAPERARHRGPARGQDGPHRRPPATLRRPDRHRRRQGDRRVVEPRLRRHVAAGRTRASTPATARTTSSTSPRTAR